MNPGPLDPGEATLRRDWGTSENGVQTLHRIHYFPQAGHVRGLTRLLDILGIGCADA